MVKPNDKKHKLYKQVKFKTVLLLLFFVTFLDTLLSAYINSQNNISMIVLYAVLVFICLNFAGLVYSIILGGVVRHFGEKSLVFEFYKIFIFISASVVIFQMLLVTVSPILPIYVSVACVILYANYMLIGLTINTFSIKMRHAVLYNGLVPIVGLLIFLLLGFLMSILRVMLPL